MQENKKFWITVASRTGMKVFKYEYPSRELSLIHTLDHPEGHLKDSEIGTGRPGRAFDSIGMARHSVETHQSPTQHLAETFAKQIAKFLDEGRINKEYTELILVAEPSFLGLLRQNLSPASNKKLVHSINKDFSNKKEEDLKLYLEKNVNGFLKSK